MSAQEPASPVHRPTATMDDTDELTDNTDPAPRQPRRKGGRKKKGGLGGGLPTDAVGDVPGQALDTVGDAVGTVGDTVGQAHEAVGGLVKGVSKAGGGGGDDKDTLRLRLDLNLEIEVTLKARIHGDLTLALLQ